MDPPAAISGNRSRPQGMESVLEWTVLAPYRTATSCFNDDAVALAHVQSLPNISYKELSRLASKYIVGVHLKNPLLDLAELDRLISQVAENGLDWSSTTCLVTLVCAIGAITQEYQYHGRTPVSDAVPETPVDFGSEPELSMQFWNLAVKRLGFVIGDNDPVAIQCLCLAGYVKLQKNANHVSLIFSRIWSMHQMQPLQAWKYFNLAGSSWYSVNLTK